PIASDAEVAIRDPPRKRRGIDDVLVEGRDEDVVVADPVHLREAKRLRSGSRVPTHASFPSLSFPCRTRGATVRRRRRRRRQRLRRAPVLAGQRTSLTRPFPATTSPSFTASTSSSSKCSMIDSSK